LTDYGTACAATATTQAATATTAPDYQAISILEFYIYSLDHYRSSYCKRSR
jgi:hypothetical protein